MRIGLDETDLLIEQDNAPAKKKTLIIAILAGALFLIALHIHAPENAHAKFFSPEITVLNLKYGLQILWAKILHHPTATIYSSIPDYFYNNGWGWTLLAGKRYFIFFICGMMLAMSGFIFQNVFRNPIAVPTMLGISGGISIVQAHVTIGALAANVSLLTAILHQLESYSLFYLGGLVSLTVVLLLAKLASGYGRFYIDNALLVGIALTALVCCLQGKPPTIYLEVSEVSYIDDSWTAIISMLVVFLLCTVPMWFMRFSFNAVTYSSDEMMGLGLHPVAFRAVTLLIGTLLITTAMVHTGAVGILALVVPHISRAIYGADFRKAFWGNLLIGGILLMICRVIADLVVYLPGVGNISTVGILASFISIPLFIIFMYKSQKGWE